MTGTTYYWHDYETFGLDSRRDRPAQFAGIRTDEQFQPLSVQPDVWYCRPSTDYLPHPEACVLTQITPQCAQAQGIAEAEFAQRIRAQMTRAGTVSIGYNSLRFDDEVTRHLFWRNLFDAYEREWRDGCSRWDLYPFVLAVWALRPEGIVWPIVKDEDPRRNGAVSFRLERLTQANGLAHEHAHDAASDVQATIALAQLLAQKKPQLWRWILANRTKKAVQGALARGTPCVWIDPRAGRKAGFIRCVMQVALNPQRPNECLVWDCREDPDVLTGLSDEQMRERAFCKAQALGEQKRLPLFRLKVNESPFVCADLRILTPEVCARFSLDIASIVANGEKLTQLYPKLAGPLQGIFETAAPAEEKPLDPDVALYGGGFTGAADQEMMRRVDALRSQPGMLTAAVNEGRIYFEDSRLQQLLWRMRARSWPETLTPGERERWKQHCEQCLLGADEHRSLETYQELMDGQAELNLSRFEKGEIDESVYQQRQIVLDALDQWGQYVADSVLYADDAPEHSEQDEQSEPVPAPQTDESASTGSGADTDSKPTKENEQ